MVKKGKEIELSCKAGGNPPPEVHWTKEGGGLVSQGKTVMAGSGLVLSSVTREDEGLYLCTASNGVGAPASASVRLTVLCKLEIIPPGLGRTAGGITVTLYSSALTLLSSDPPEIELETNRVHSGIDKEAHLTCRVQGNPEPSVSWYKDSNLLSQSESVSFRTEESRHTLILR